VYGSVFYALTGFHALHVAGGAAALAIIAVQLALQTASGRRRDRAPVRALRLTALYWDFVAIVWVAMYVTVYWL
jgi:cytochrome c oxidase subunit 3